MRRLAFTACTCRSIEGIGADSRPNVGSTPPEINSNWWSERAHKMAHIIGRRKLLKGKLTFSTCRTKRMCSPFPAGIWDHHDNRGRAILFYSFVLPPAAFPRCFDWAVTSTGGSRPRGETRPASITRSSPVHSMHGQREKYQRLNSIWNRFHRFHFWDILFGIKDIFCTRWQKYCYLQCIGNSEKPQSSPLQWLSYARCLLTEMFFSRSKLCIIHICYFCNCIIHISGKGKHHWKQTSLTVALLNPVPCGPLYFQHLSVSTTAKHVAPGASGNTPAPNLLCFLWS